MTTNMKNPTSLLEAIRYYSNETVCVEFLSSLKWDGGEKCCPKCGSVAVYGLRTRPVFKCRDCKKQFSIKVGTIMQDSPLPITKWVPAIWMVVNCKNGISSCEMARALGITQKSAWHMNHRIRQAIANDSVAKLSGVVEADETFIGGKDINRHANKKRRMNPYMPSDKTIVMGMVERQGKVVSKVVNNTTAHSLKSEIRKHVERDSVLYTDNFPSYDGMGHEYYRDVVNHANGEYVKGDVHTNTVENYWSLVKRMLKGTYIHVEPFHLDRYLDEQGFRFNTRKGNDSERFTQAASQIFGTTLTYAELIGANQQ
ncbi:MAG: IS1595 family transposase [Bacteroidota bacterium]|nr:IS1595 family transposase [Bacteroidota bacterium]MDP4232406.1 IS1595 family transposase [Bacteroidota bacterium]MDP4288276.1 IS1595 family transposase [Bacteroidota bacterium]